MKETINIASTDLEEGLGRIVNDAFNENIGVVAKTVEGNTKKYEKALVNGKYWARSEKYSDSIDNLKKLFTPVWERAGHKGYRKSVIEGFNRKISELQKADETSINHEENKEGTAESGGEWLESENGKRIFGLINGLTAFRTLYRFNEKYGGSKPKDKMTMDEVSALFTEVFYESKQDSWYRTLCERYFGGDEEKLKQYIKHDWDCYLTQFFVICRYQIHGQTVLESVFDKVATEIRREHYEEEISSQQRINNQDGNKQQQQRKNSNYSRSVNNESIDENASTIDKMFKIEPTARFKIEDKNIKNNKSNVNLKINTTNEIKIKSDYPILKQVADYFGEAYHFLNGLSLDATEFTEIFKDMYLLSFSSKINKYDTTNEYNEFTKTFTTLVQLNVSPKKFAIDYILLRASGLVEDYNRISADDRPEWVIDNIIKLTDRLNRIIDINTDFGKRFLNKEANSAKGEEESEKSLEVEQEDSIDIDSSEDNVEKEWTNKVIELKLASTFLYKNQNTVKDWFYKDEPEEKSENMSCENSQEVPVRIMNKSFWKTSPLK